MSRLLDELIAAEAIEEEKRRAREGRRPARPRERSEPCRPADVPTSNGNGNGHVLSRRGLSEGYLRRREAVDGELKTRAIARETATRCGVSWYDLDSAKRERWVAIVRAVLAAIDAVDCAE